MRRTCTSKRSQPGMYWPSAVTLSAAVAAASDAVKADDAPEASSASPVRADGASVAAAGIVSAAFGKLSFITSSNPLQCDRVCREGSSAVQEISKSYNYKYV